MSLANRLSENSLISKLDNAARLVRQNNLQAALNLLNAFDDEVKAQSGKKLTTDYPTR